MPYREPSAIVRKAAPRARHSADFNGSRVIVSWRAWGWLGPRQIRAIKGPENFGVASGVYCEWFDLDTGKRLSWRRCRHASWIEKTHRALNTGREGSECS